MDVVFLIIARLKSTRLPRKVIREVKGRPIITHMIERLKRSKETDQIVMCTSTNTEDDPLVTLAHDEGIHAFRGDEKDVVRRMYNAAESFGADYILTITGDCPLVDPEYADRIVEEYRCSNPDLIRALQLPHGAYSYGIKPNALKKVINIKKDDDTEVWGPYFTDTDLFDVHDLSIDREHRKPGIRMTLDYPEDLEFFKAVFDELYRPDRYFGLDDILSLLDEKPEITKINEHREQDYERRWSNQATIRLKSRHDVDSAVIFGCGSIGQRHIRNLQEIGISQITALRSKEGHTQELPSDLDVQEVFEWSEVVEADPDFAVVSNPTSLHVETAKRIAPHVKGLFIEKPIADTSEELGELLDLLEEERVVSFVGYNLAFHPVVKTVQRFSRKEKLGAPLILQAQVGQWLPDWHPYEDHTEAYYAREDLGGGVTLTLSHEIHLARELLGPVESVSAFMPKSERLSLEVDVISDMQLRHKGKAASQLHLDYIQRPMHRRGTLSFERGWVQYNLTTPRVVVNSEEREGSDIILEDSDFDTNRQYIDEMQTFIEYVREGRVRHTNDAWKGAEILKIAEAAFQSSKSNRNEQVANIKK